MTLIIQLLLLMVASGMPQPAMKHIIFFGDSITEMGVQPGGYIRQVDSLCAASEYAGSYKFTGAGIGGNKVYDLFLRMEQDVLAKKPQIVVIYIGVNDVWHKRLTGTGTDLNKFEQFYKAIIQKLKAQQISVIVCTPAVIGEKTDCSNELDGDLNAYAASIRKLAQQQELELVDLRQEFLNYNRVHNKDNRESGILTYDRVHLNQQGNLLVAQAMWQVIKRKQDQLDK